MTIEEGEAKMRVDGIIGRLALRKSVQNGCSNRPEGDNIEINDDTKS